MDKRSGVIIIALLLVTAIVFTACGKSRESEETVSRSEAVEATSEPTTEESTETTAETTTTKEEPTTKAESETMVLIAVDKEKLPEEVSEDMLIYDEGTGTYYVSQESMTEPATTKAAQQSEPATSKQQETTKATEPATTKAAETTKATEPATTKAEETTTAHTHTWVDVTKYVQCEAICFV